MRGAWTAFSIAWIGVILWLGSDIGSADRTRTIVLPILRSLFPAAAAPELEAMHGVIRKAAHGIEYAVLAASWIRALTLAPAVSRLRAAWQACAIAGGVAIVDEVLQSTIRSRGASAVDVALDVSGAFVVALPVAGGVRRTMERLTRVALWTAAGGGAALLAVNRIAGVDSGALWLTVPAAAVALVILRRLKRSGADPVCRADRRRRG
jgi:VanZ family protein